MAALHANTVAAPGPIREQLEGHSKGHFDFANVDQIVQGARAHNLHVILLWFGTWKNGNNHYAPAWVKADTKRYPRMIRPDGEPIDVLSANSRNTMEGGQGIAFTALMRHLKEIDGEDHTVLMIQVENESGGVGETFATSPPNRTRSLTGQVSSGPAAFRRHTKLNLVRGARSSAGMPTRLFRPIIRPNTSMRLPPRAKLEFAIPYYINVWISYPAAWSCMRSARSRFRAFNIPAAERCRSWWACGRRWRRRST